MTHARARPLHLRGGGPSPGKPLATPLVLATTCHLPGDPASLRRYGRGDNPAWEALEAALGHLQPAEAVIFPRGIAASRHRGGAVHDAQGGASGCCCPPRRQPLRPGFLIGFGQEDAAAGDAAPNACALLAVAISFGGVHSSPERRARWGDAVAPPACFTRLSMGIEAAEPLWVAIAGAL